MKTSTGLRKAGEIVSSRGWCQGAMEMPDGRVCAVGALYAAGAETHHDHHCVARRVMNLAVAGEAVMGLGLADWNDAPERTRSDVRRAFDEAARIAESAEWTDKHWPEARS